MRQRNSFVIHLGNTVFLGMKKIAFHIEIEKVVCPYFKLIVTQLCKQDQFQVIEIFSNSMRGMYSA